MKRETKKTNRMLLDYMKGFGLVVGVSTGLGVLGWFLLQNFDAGFEPVEAFQLLLILVLLALITVGGEIAFSMLFSNKHLFGGRFRFMHFLGGVSAWVSAFYVGPLLLGYLEPSDLKEKCETVFEKKVGPVSFSTQKCDE